MTAEYDFQDRMAAGKQAAMDARNRGRSIGGKRVPLHRRPIEDTPENRLYVELADLRRELRDAHNTIDQYKMSPGSNDVDDFGLEFDRLSASAKVGSGLPAAPLPPCNSTTAARPRGVRTMTKRQYLDALKKLELTPSSRQTAEALGLSLRQCQRIASGESAVPEAVAKLLAMYLEHGMPSV